MEENDWLLNHSDTVPSTPVQQLINIHLGFPEMEKMRHQIELWATRLGEPEENWTYRRFIFNPDNCRSWSTLHKERCSGPNKQSFQNVRFIGSAFLKSGSNEGGTPYWFELFACRRDLIPSDGEILNLCDSKFLG